MKWRKVSPDTIGSEGYLITRLESSVGTRFTAWGPERKRPLLGYWGETADRAREVCNEHRARVCREGRGA